jgi:signal transduction histidine kinase
VRQREDAVHRYAALLEARNRDLDAYAGRVAHDLRGPLTTISLASQTLGRTGAQEDRTLAILRRGVASMEALIQDLLELSRLDAHEPAGRSDPAAAAAHVQEDLAARLAAEAVTLRVDTAPASVRCGGGLLRQALANLVDNAAKYRRADVPAQIDLEGRLAGSRYELRVTDNGIGMTPAEAGQAFDPFYRALGVRDRPGTGLGLSIVKRVVEASGGEITVESRAGQGTTFVIRLPLAVDDGRPAP